MQNPHFCIRMTFCLMEAAYDNIEAYVRRQSLRLLERSFMVKTVPMAYILEKFNPPSY